MVNKYLGIQSQEQFYTAIQNNNIKIADYKFHVVKGKLADRIVSRKINAEMLTICECIKNIILIIFSSDYRAAKKYAKENLKNFGITYLETYDPRTQLVNQLYAEKADPIADEKELDIQDLRAEVKKLSDQEVTERLNKTQDVTTSEEVDESRSDEAGSSTSSSPSIDSTSEETSEEDVSTTMETSTRLMLKTDKTIVDLLQNEELSEDEKARLELLQAINTKEMQVKAQEETLERAIAFKNEGNDMDTSVLEESVIALKSELEALTLQLAKK